MCGITGTIFNAKAKGISRSKIRTEVQESVKSLKKRGPDSHDVYQEIGICLGHTRLTVIDPSYKASQPMTDDSGQYTIVFNGEFYNYKVQRDILENEGVKFYTQSDTEVLLQLYIKHGINCLDKINGFFAFAIWDNWNRSILIARDRIGIKPLFWSASNTQLCFASEMKGLKAYKLAKSIDKASLFTYLQLNYIPAPNSIFENIHKLLPGHYLFIENIDSAELEKTESIQYYQIPNNSFSHSDINPESYSTAQETLVELLNESVKKRMVADVPIGAFLSGGIDSSIICALATRHTHNLKTFSIGYKDNPYFDETEYAQLVANKFRTDHKVFSLSKDDFFENIDEMIDYIDEPFADSSIINFFILSKYTRKEIKVALSGDGADEMFGGYNKHFAEYQARNPGIKGAMISAVSPLFKNLPQSREGKLSNMNRQLNKFSKGMKLSNRERYWQWACGRDEEIANYLMIEIPEEREHRLSDLAFVYKKRKEQYLKHISKTGNLDDVLYNDMHLVLPNDMLYKVDQASMANSLEVRTPFLDTNVVDFAFEIPLQFKINHNMRKKILQDAFKNILPPELYNRPKKGFELPLQDWMRQETAIGIQKELFDKDWLVEQNIFNPKAVKSIQAQLNSKNPGDSASTIWSLMVFQKWYNNMH